MTNQDLAQAIADLLDQRDQIAAADIQRSRLVKPVDFVSLVLALDTARAAGDPFPINEPFRSLVVATASDTLTYVNFTPNSKSVSAQSGAFKMDIGAKFKSSSVVGQGYLTWPAQPGKSITLYFSLDGEFSLGKQYSVNSGGVTINEGSSFSQGLLGDGTKTTVAVSGTRAQILPQDASRFMATIQNTVDMYIGDAGVAVGQGILVPAGSTTEIRNTAAIYAITAGGAGNVTGIVEK